MTNEVLSYDKWVISIHQRNIAGNLSWERKCHWFGTS